MTHSNNDLWRGFASRIALLALLAAACGSDGTVDDTDPSPVAPLVIAWREPPNISPTTVPELVLPVHEEFEEQPDGTLVASIEADVFFAYASAVLTPEAREALGRLLPEIFAHEGVIRVDGYTDGVGQAHRNQRLSEARAEAVASWLREAGVTHEVTVAGHGEVLAVDESHDPGLRRVDIVLVPHE